MTWTREIVREHATVAAHLLSTTSLVRLVAGRVVEPAHPRIANDRNGPAESNPRERLNTPTAQRGSLRPGEMRKNLAQMIAPVAVWPAAEYAAQPWASRRRRGRAEAANPFLLTMAEVVALVGEPAGNRDDALGQMMQCRGGGVADRCAVVGSGDGG
jgi:hypothetical protein